MLTYVNYLFPHLLESVGIDYIDILHVVKSLPKFTLKLCVGIFHID